MQRLRVSKYNKSYRNELGHYLRDDWTSIGDVGRVCEGELVTMEEYERVENNYLKTLREVADLFAVSDFEVRSLEIYPSFGIKNLGFPLMNDMTIPVDNFLELAKRTLREELWAEFISSDLEVYFGYDYYMYLVFNQQMDKVKAIIEQNNLFWEENTYGYFDEQDYGDG